MTEWIRACAADDVDEEDVIRFDHAGRTFAIYRSPDNAFFATDGLCTHEKVHLADGLVMTRRQAMALGKSAASPEAIARGLSARRLSALISPAPVRAAKV